MSRKRLLCTLSVLKWMEPPIYCLRLSDQIVILGNGGVKTTRTYQEDPKLYGYVLDLQRFEMILDENLKKGYVSIQEKDLSGIEDLEAV